MIKTQLKYLIHSLIVILLITLISSCQTRRDANEAMVEADSLLAKGVIIRDTAVLAGVIRALDNHVGRVFAREELAKAYYLMGRNLDDYHHNFADAADCYIEADRLKTKDLILRGRINSCMGYLCKQDSCFEEALVFYERANVAFAKSGNERRYANGLVSIAEQYVNMEEYNKADSVLSLASRYEIDSALYARMIDVNALALYNQQKYNLALACLLETKDYQQNVEVQSYRAMKMMQLYARMDSLRQTIPLANYILQNSTNAIFRSNAYFYLIQDAEKPTKLKEVAKYSYLREDEDRKVQHNSEYYAQASTKLKVYL